MSAITYLHFTCDFNLRYLKQCGTWRFMELILWNLRELGAILPSLVAWIHASHTLVRVWRPIHLMKTQLENHVTLPTATWSSHRILCHCSCLFTCFISIVFWASLWLCSWYIKFARVTHTETHPRIYPMKFCWKLMEIIPGLMSTTDHGFTPMPATFDAKTAFFDLPWGDLWTDADMPTLLVYLKGNKHLQIPSEWTAFLPTEIPDA